MRSLSGHCTSCGADAGEVCSADCVARLAPALTSVRKSTHGDWLQQSAIGVGLDQVVQSSPNYSGLAPHQRKAVDMILVKLSRIVNGDPYHDDHWDDIAGYAHLGKGGHTQ